MFNAFLKNTELRPKVAKRARKKNYNALLTEAISFMFERQGLPPELEQNFIEPYLLTEGVCAIWERPNFGFVATHCELGGEPYPNGIGSTAICRCDDGKVQEFKNWIDNPKVCVMFNNLTKTPDYTIGMTSEVLGEIDGAIKLQVKHSKLYPIPVVRNDKQKAAIEGVMSKIDNEEYGAIVSDNVLDDVLGTGKRDVYTVDVTRPEMSDHIQYLTHAKDDVWRFMWQLYGMNSQGTSKMAQQSVEEVTNNDAASLTIPLGRLKQRQLDTVVLNRKFGWNVTVDFSEAWRTRVEKAVDVDSAAGEGNTTGEDENAAMGENGGVDNENNNM